MSRYHRFMAFLLLIVLLCAIGGSVYATQETLRSEYQNASFPPPNVPQGEAVSDEYFSDALLIGDSLSVGIEQYLDLPWLDVFAKNGLSVKAATSHSAFTVEGQTERARLADLLPTRSPGKVYIWLGVNGLNHASAEKILSDYEELLDLVLSHYPQALVYLIEVLPVRENARESNEMLTRENITRFNEGLRELAAARGLYVLPLHDFFADQEGDLQEKHAAGDGLHLRAYAYTRVAEFLSTHTIPDREAGEDRWDATYVNAAKACMGSRGKKKKSCFSDVSTTSIDICGVMALYPGICREAAIDRQHNPIDEIGGLFIKQKQQRAFQLLGMTEAAHRRRGQDFARACGRCTIGIPKQRGANWQTADRYWDMGVDAYVATVSRARLLG